MNRTTTVFGREDVPKGGYVCEVAIGRRVISAPLKPVLNPAHCDEIVGAVAQGTVGHIEEAVHVAISAGAEWSAVSIDTRRQRLIDAADAIESRIEELALLLTREQGKTRLEAEFDVRGAAVSLRYYADLATEALGDRTFRENDSTTILLGKRPIGVTGVIVPWNSPVHLAFLGIAPSLAAGNAVVVKPSSMAPLALGKTLEIVADLLPAGVINVVPGSGDVGAAIAAHPGVRKIFFTGSTETGKKIMEAAASNLKRLSLELGGNDPAIVLASATITEKLALEVLRGTFALSGQVCFGIKRIYVHRSRYDDFVREFTSVAERITVGDGTNEVVTMGPVNNRQQFDRVHDLIGAARESGATVAEAGTVADPASWDSGYFIRPTIVTGISAHHSLVVEEQFGPVVPIIAFEDEDEVVGLANGTEFGLAASIWTDDISHAFELAPRIQAGSVFINAHRAGVSDVSTPFGGFKQSGLGREHGLAALDACLETQVIGEYRDVSGFPLSALS